MRKCTVVNAPIGMPFLFKLKKPYNHIAGGGFYVTYSTLPINLAWEMFGQKNGSDTLIELSTLVSPLTNKAKANNHIGCTILANPFFFDEDQWIPTPSSFSLNIVRGKMYDSLNEDGFEIWSEVEKRVIKRATPTPQQPSLSIKEAPEKYGKPYLTKPRLGQGSFRLLVTDAYNRRCAITGESTLPVLEAAHIKPYSEDGTHTVQNGMLLRADFHKLFDNGLVTVTPDFKIKISPLIHESWFNGKAYYRLHNKRLASLPENPESRPSQDYLAWHNNTKFVGE